jgi:nitroreductase
MKDRIALLLGRRSCHALAAPGPHAASLDLILRAALRVPDFHHLHPYRFVVAEGDGLARLGERMQAAARAAGRSPAEIERAPRMPLRAPMVIVVVFSPKDSPVVPAFDQLLSAGCTVMAMQVAAQGLGYGGVWRSGWPMHEAAMAAELGLAPGERIVGFLYLGTPAKAVDPAPDLDPAPFVTRL